MGIKSLSGFVLCGIVPDQGAYNSSVLFLSQRGSGSCEMLHWLSDIVCVIELIHATNFEFSFIYDVYIILPPVTYPRMTCICVGAHFCDSHPIYAILY